MPSSDLPMLVCATLGLLVLVGAGEALRASGRVQAEGSRRLVHAGTGLFAAATPWLFDGPALLYGLGAAFVLVNAVAARRGWLPGMHGIARPSAGTATFPLVFVLALWVCWSMDPGRVFAMQLAFAVLAVSDPLASLVGTRVARPRPYRVGGHVKSVAGTAAFAGSAFVLCLAGLLWCRADGVVAATVGEVVAVAAVAALAAAAAEALGGGGWDNFFVVVAVGIVLVAFDERPAVRPWLFAAAPVGVAFGLLAYRLRFLDASGALAGGLLGASVVGVGGWAWIAPSFAFFFLSSLLSKAGARRKAPAQRMHEKGHVRDAGQVYANGAVGWALLAGHAVAPSPLWYAGFLGAFAAAAADTWATEIGLLARGAPRLLLTGRRVPRGTSGAVSAPGTAGALLGACVVWLAAWPFATGAFAFAAAPAAAAAVAGAGLAGAFADSLAGMTVQARYRDPATGGETERRSAGGVAHVRVRGHAWIDNDRVNLFATGVGAAVAAAWAALHLPAF